MWGILVTIKSKELITDVRRYVGWKIGRSLSSWLWNLGLYLLFKEYMKISKIYISAIYYSRLDERWTFCLIQQWVILENKLYLVIFNRKKIIADAHSSSSKYIIRSFMSGKYTSYHVRKILDKIKEEKVDTNPLFSGAIVLWQVILRNTCSCNRAANKL